jgi:CBS domain-containing protein
MQVSEVMTRQVELVDPKTAIQEAARRMRDGDVGALPVGQDGQLVGMITDRDIVVCGLAEGRDASTTVQEVLSPSVFFCRESDTIENAADAMAEHQVRRLPVLDENDQLVGIVALGDVARADQDAGGAALDDVSQPGQIG